MLAAVTNRRAVIQPKAIDSGWTVVPNIWGMVIGEPGTMKTPATGAILHLHRVLRDAQTNLEKSA